MVTDGFVVGCCAVSYCACVSRQGLEPFLGCLLGTYRKGNGCWFLACEYRVVSFAV